MANPYDFLNDYLSKVSSDTGKFDPNVDMEENDFYDTASDDQPVDEDIQYGISQNDDQDDFMNEPDQDDNNNLDYLLGDEDPYSMGAEEGEEDDSEDGETGGGVPGVPEMAPATVIGRRNSLGNKISANESQGKYSAFNPKGGGGGAVGKYQFRWNIWKDSIQKVTGISSKDEFLKSPEAQEKYYNWYEKHYLKPAADKIQQYNKAGLSMDQLEQLVHFRGEGGAKKYLQGKLADKPESYNMSISKYIAKHQTGGSSFYMNPTTHFMMGGVPIAVTGSAQFNGLNNSSFHEMMFPMEGVNTFRGLDDGEPVYLEDEAGKKKVLRGRHQRTKMTGKVYEKRLKS
jgi:hypothetical protein